MIDIATTLILLLILGVLVLAYSRYEKAYRIGVLCKMADKNYDRFCEAVNSSPDWRISNKEIKAKTVILHLRESNRLVILEYVGCKRQSTLNLIEYINKKYDEQAQAAKRGSFFGVKASPATRNSISTKESIYSFRVATQDWVSKKEAFISIGFAQAILKILYIIAWVICIICGICLPGGGNEIGVLVFMASIIFLIYASILKNDKLVAFWMWLNRYDLQECIEAMDKEAECLRNHNDSIKYDAGDTIYDLFDSIK